jgi:hypothetical protein
VILRRMEKEEAPRFDGERSIPGLRYEYDRAVAYAIMLVKPTPVLNPIMYDALLESFGVHVRNLHEFFQLEKRKDGDYRASCFYEDFQRTVFDEDTVKKINWWLQHLTTWRYDLPKKPQWRIPNMLNRVVVCMDDFLNEDPSDQDLLEPLVAPHEVAKEFLIQVAFDPNDSLFVTSRRP